MHGTVQALGSSGLKSLGSWDLHVVRSARKGPDGQSLLKAQAHINVAGRAQRVGVVFLPGIG